MSLSSSWLLWWATGEAFLLQWPVSGRVVIAQLHSLRGTGRWRTQLVQFCQSPAGHCWHLTCLLKVPKTYRKLHLQSCNIPRSVPRRIRMCYIHRQGLVHAATCIPFSLRSVPEDLLWNNCALPFSNTSHQSALNFVCNVFSEHSGAYFAFPVPQVAPWCLTFFTWPATELLRRPHHRKGFPPTYACRCPRFGVVAALGAQGYGGTCWLGPHLRKEGCDFLAVHFSPPLPSFSEHEWKLEGLFEPDPGFLRGDGDNKNRGLLSTPGPGVWTTLVRGWASGRCTLASSLHLPTSLKFEGYARTSQVAKTLSCEICLKVHHRDDHPLMW